MEIRLESKKSSPLSGIEPVLSEIEQQLRKEPQAWLKQMEARPESFLELEKSVHRAFQQMADRVVAGLLAQATGPAEFAEAAKKSNERLGSEFGREFGRERRDIAAAAEGGRGASAASASFGRLDLVGDDALFGSGGVDGEASRP